MDGTKKPALLLLARVFDEAGLPYAIIGGIALQVHADEPRTTVDISLAVPDRHALPDERLSEAGFLRTGEFEHTVNYRSADGVPAQISDDPLFSEAIRSALTVVVDGVPLRVMTRPELVRAKLRAARDPGRRRSKRGQDLADVQGLLETSPELDAVLSEDDRALLDRTLP